MQLCAMFDVGQENVGPLECDWVRICVVGWRGTRLFLLEVATFSSVLPHFLHQRSSFMIESSMKF